MSSVPDVKMYTREGCRGGRDNFKWDTLKEQDFKDREQYLGGVMKTGLMGKFGRYYVHDWYTKSRDKAASIEEERKSIQEYEEELMQEALGLKPKKLLIQKKQLSEEELAEFLKKDSEKTAEQQKGRDIMGGQNKNMAMDNSGQMVEADKLYADSRVSGLGFAAHRNAKLEKYKAEVLGTESKLEGIKCEIKSEVKNEPMTDTDRLRLGPGGASSSSSGVKKEEKVEVKPEGELKVEAEIKEIKDEPVAADPQASKRPHEDEDPEERKRRKAEKKEKKDKKKKKAEKKAKKKVKKAIKKQKKADKLAAKLSGRGGGRQASSTASSSSSS